MLTRKTKMRHKENATSQQQAFSKWKNALSKREARPFQEGSYVMLRLSSFFCLQDKRSINFSFLGMISLLVPSLVDINGTSIIVILELFLSS